MLTGPARLRGVVRFGGSFELDFDSYKLRRGGRVLKLERIPMDILLFLVEQRTQIVTREQIVERIWGKGIFLDTDNSINGAIHKIRQALHDDSGEPRYIQTISGQGYRFVASVVDTPVPETEDQPPASDENASEPRGAGAEGATDTAAVPLTAAGPAGAGIGVSRIESDQQRSGTLWLVSLGALLALLAGLVAAWRWSVGRNQPQPSTGRLMVAVLPFQNLTGDASQEYFSDGLTEELITQLGNLAPQRLGVIGRTSVMHYKNTKTSLDQIGRELSVSYVLEGSVRRYAGQVRITAQLLQMKDQSHLWAREYDRELKNVLVVQGEIAQEVADEIQVALKEDKKDKKSLTGVQSPRPPENYEAYDLYLKGQYFFNKRTVPGFEEAIRYFQQAAAKDPKYARAHAGLADSYALIGGYGMRPQSDYLPKAREAALKALEMDESLPEGHTALALIVQNYDWDWQTAEKEFGRAIELNPNDATAHQWYAEHLMWRGRFDEALAESERARQLDPLSLIIAADNGAILYFSRQYDRAIEKWRSVLELDPDFPRAGLISLAYVEKGMFKEALAVVEAHRPPADAPWYWLYLACIYGRSGQEAQAEHALSKLLQLNQRQAVDPCIIAFAYAGLRDKDRTLAWLEKAYAQHSNELTTLKVNPAYDFLRRDPRFEELQRRIGLTE